MSILAVVVVSSLSAATAAVIAYRSASAGIATRHDLWLYALGGLVLAALLSVYVVFWSAALGGNMRELLLPDLLANRPGRTMFLAYALASAGFATGVVALFVGFVSRRGKA